MPSSFQAGRVFHAAVLVLVGVALAFAATDPAFGWMIPIALGGGLIATVLLANRPSRHHAEFSVDSFDRAGRGDIINMSRVRVAGLGGLGLLLVSIAVAFQYPLATTVLIAGIAGGVVTGVGLIVYRRHQIGAHA